MFKLSLVLFLLSTFLIVKSINVNPEVKKRQIFGITGGEREISTSDTYAKLAMGYVLDMVNKISNDTSLFNMVKLNKAFIKVVSGYLYRLEYEIGKIACQKGATNNQICFMDTKKGIKNCSGKVWFQAWKPQNKTYQLIENKCS
jgi:hypothetical protein